MMDCSRATSSFLLGSDNWDFATKMEFFLELASVDTSKEPHLEAEGSEEASQLSEVPTREELECVTAAKDELQT